MKTYRAAVIGCGRMGGFIDNEVVGAPGHVPPYAHGGGFYACDRTDLVACSDFRADLMAVFGEQYAVPTDRQYTDYQEMIAREDLDIVSVATHVEHHADIVIHAAEQGVKAIFCEKGMAPSLATANAMAAACEHHGTIFNMGTQRRYHPGFWQMREIIEQGELGALQSLVMTYGGGLFDHGCHTMDLALYLNGDTRAVWVQGHAPQSEPLRDGHVYRDDPGGDGVVLFENGVTLYLLCTNRYEYQANCVYGMVGTYNDSSTGSCGGATPAASGRWNSPPSPARAPRSTRSWTWSGHSTPAPPRAAAWSRRGTASRSWWPSWSPTSKAVSGSRSLSARATW